MFPLGFGFLNDRSSGIDNLLAIVSSLGDGITKEQLLAWTNEELKGIATSGQIEALWEALPKQSGGNIDMASFLAFCLEHYLLVASLFPICPQLMVDFQLVAQDLVAHLHCCTFLQLVGS